MLFVAFGALVLVPLLTGLDPNVALFTAGLGTLLFHVVTKGQVPMHLRPFIDRILVVDIDQETQIKRVISRDKIDETQAMKIISSQSSREQKLAQADDVIDNSGDLQQLESQVELLHNQYMKLSNS